MSLFMCFILGGGIEICYRIRIRVPVAHFGVVVLHADFGIVFDLVGAFAKAADDQADNC